MRAQTTQKDIAKRLEISVSTVARALAGSPRISRETVERVRAEAERCGYAVDLAARSVRQGTTSLIGFVAPDLQNDFYATAVQAVSSECQARGLQLVVAVTNDDAASELQHLRNLYSSRVRGVVIIPSIDMSKASHQLLGRMAHVQLVRHREELGSDWFGIADEEAMRLGVSHLASLGHSRIGYIGSALSLSTGARRLDGFRRALVEFGLDSANAVVEVGACDAEYGHAAMGRILSLRPDVSAVVTAGARLSAGAYACIRERGVRIPEQLSFVGFADGPSQRFWGEGLTTIGLPVEDIATAAMDCLLRKSDGESPTRLHAVNVMHRPVLIVRGSTAAPQPVAVNA